MIRGYLLAVIVVFLQLAVSPAQNRPLPSVTSDTIIVYLIPGQGADCRLFDRIELSPPFVKHCLPCPMPDKGIAMHEYAHNFVPFIDTTHPFCLVGVSLGGMICTELSTILSPTATVIISSAKSRNELPAKYLMLDYVSVHKVVPSAWFKTGAKIAQPLVEPDRNTFEDTFVDMLNDKDGLFLKRTTDMIVGWEREEAPPDIIHIHGNADNTLPVNNILYDYLIEQGSHMMVYTRADDISPLLQRVLLQQVMGR